MRDECEICRGRKIIRLPIYRRAVAFDPDKMPDTIEESFREFPCPQCSETVTLGQVGAIEEVTFGDSRYENDPGFIDHVKGSLTHMIVGQLLNSGYIRFERWPVDTYEMRFMMRAQVGVVHPSKLDTLEQRIAERQTEVAGRVASEAIAQINNWGSALGHQKIDKLGAVRLVREALDTVLRQFWGKP